MLNWTCLRLAALSPTETNQQLLSVLLLPSTLSPRMDSASVRVKKLHAFPAAGTLPGAWARAEDALAGTVSSSRLPEASSPFGSGACKIAGSAGPAAGTTTCPMSSRPPSFIT